MPYERMRIFTGTANPKLAGAVCRHLNISLGRCVVGRFSDGEVMVELLENVRGRDVFILQSTCAPTNDNLMEVLVMVDALKRASAARITAAIPYFGYARQDRRPRSARVPISAKVVADMLMTVGIDRVMVMDLGSSNGTYINGRRINPHVEESLSHGDIVALGKLKIQVLLRNI